MDETESVQRGADSGQAAECVRELKRIEREYKFSGEVRMITQHAYALIDSQARQLAAAQAEIECLREYARHKNGCNKEYDDRRECTCGFEQKGGE